MVEIAFGFTNPELPVELLVQYTLEVFEADPVKITELSSQIVWSKPALITCFGSKFKIIKSETVFEQGAIPVAETVNMIGEPAIISAALGVYIGFNIVELLKVPLFGPLLELEVQLIEAVFDPVTPVIWKGILEQFVLFSTPASSNGSFWITTAFVAVATEHTGSP